MSIPWLPVKAIPEVIFKRGSAEDWRLHDPILGLDEIARTEPTGRFKVGVGDKRWSELNYVMTLPHTMKFYRRAAPEKPKPWWQIF
jgi:hypothetical protein